MPKIKKTTKSVSRLSDKSYSKRGLLVQNDRRYNDEDFTGGIVLVGNGVTIDLTRYRK